MYVALLNFNARARPGNLCLSKNIYVRSCGAMYQAILRNGPQKIVVYLASQNKRDIWPFPPRIDPLIRCGNFKDIINLKKGELRRLGSGLQAMVLTALVRPD